LAEGGGGGLGFGGDDDAGGLGIEPVDEARALAVRSGEGGEQAVERAVVRVAGLHRQARRLVEGEDGAVLVDDKGADEGSVFGGDGLLFVVALGHVSRGSGRRPVSRRSSSGKAEGRIPGITVEPA